MIDLSFKKDKIYFFLKIIINFIDGRQMGAKYHFPMDKHKEPEHSPIYARWLPQNLANALNHTKYMSKQRYEALLIYAVLIFHLKYLQQASSLHGLWWRFGKKCQAAVLANSKS